MHEHSTPLSRFLVITLLAAGVACAAPGPEAPEIPPASPPLADYVLIGRSAPEGEPAALARAIVAGVGSTCPTIAFSDDRPPMPMQLRANPDPQAFPVSVCEAVVATGAGVTARVDRSDHDLPIPDSPAAAVERLVAIADTGCKGDASQPCADAWPFPAIAEAAAADDPDLVLHLGDYNYRGTPSKDAQDRWAYDGCLPNEGEPFVTQSTRDIWQTWREDFFDAARPLLEAAPWVAVRGNHELCSRAGQGWFYFLDPRSRLLDPGAAPPSCNAPFVQTDPYVIGLANLDLAVLDSANACGGEAPQSEAHRTEEVTSFARQFDAIAASLASRPASRTWLLTHRPLWGLSRWGTEPAEAITDTLQSALDTSVGGELPDSIAMVLSGHMHEFEAITFAGDRAPQLTVGNSGVLIGPDALAPGFTGTTLDGVSASGVIDTTNHGYLLFELRDGGDWSATLRAFDAAGAPRPATISCAMPVSDALCRRDRR
jgi:hypothetical protein